MDGDLLNRLKTVVPRDSGYAELAREAADHIAALEASLAEWQKKAAAAAVAWHGCIHDKETAEQRVRELEEFHRMVEAGVCVAVGCNTRASAKEHRLPPDNPYCTPAYQEACMAVEREMAEREAKEEAEAEVARLNSVMTLGQQVTARKEAQGEGIEKIVAELAQHHANLEGAASFTFNEKGLAIAKATAERIARSIAARTQEAVAVVSYMLDEEHGQCIVSLVPWERLPFGTKLYAAPPKVAHTAGYSDLSVVEFARTLERELTRTASALADTQAWHHAAEQRADALAERVLELEQTERELRRLIDRGPTVSEYELKLSAQLAEQREGNIKLLLRAENAEAKARGLMDALNAKQAKIDALMLEFCPGEMSAEQRAEWGKHQVPVPDEDVRTIDAAIAAPNASAERRD